MNKFRLVLFHLVLPAVALANEPGQLHSDQPLPPPPVVQKPKPLPKAPPPIAPAVPPPAEEAFETHMNLRRQFDQARGLTDGEAHEIHFNRVSCDRRIYSQAGWSVEGDADLKVTKISADLMEAEFPGYLALSYFDPYQSGIDRVETVVSRQLVNFAKWRDGRVLRLFKSVVITYLDPNLEKEPGYVMDEFKVEGESYPPAFIVKETISARKKYVFYYICQ